MQQLLKLLEYNFWANDQCIARLKDQDPLPEEISLLVSHLLAAHRVWLGRKAGLGSLPSVWEETKASSWEGSNIKMYNKTTDLVKSNQLERNIGYTTSKREIFEHKLEGIIYHIINHSTLHRAQVALLMRKNQILPPRSDYIFYLRR